MAEAQVVAGSSELLERLASQAAIIDALARYARGVDRADAELTRSAYHPDAIDEHGSFNGSAWEFAERVNESHARRWATTTHVLGQHLSVIAGDVADTETYVIAYLRRIDGTGVDAVGGRYVDRFERRAGDWRISRRVYVWEWSAVLDPGAPLVDGSSYRQAERSRGDVSYDGALSGLSTVPGGLGGPA
jgi:hypothetical protein